jgi:anti-anti-sigma regulatory factor
MKQHADRLFVTLEGDLDENADLLVLQPVLVGRVVLDLGGVRRINSAGVREWVNFIRDVEPRTEHLALANCSPAIVMQMNMIANFRGSAEVLSFYAPLVCPVCDREQDELIEVTPEIVAGLPDHIPDFNCAECATVLELDDIPERYFAFLKR